MKKHFALLLGLVLLLPCTACTAKSSSDIPEAKSVTATATASSSAPPQQVIYVQDAAWCKEKDIKLPQLNEKELPRKVASTINKEIKALYEDFLSSPGDPDIGIPDPAASYRWAIHKDILSVLIEYSSLSTKGPAPYYVSYHLHLPDGKRLTIQDAVKASGMSWEEVQHAYQCYINAFFIWQSYGMTDVDEDAMDLTIEAVDNAFADGSLSGLLDQEELLLCMPLIDPVMAREHYVKEFYPSTDVRKMALRNASSEELLLSIVDSPTKKELSAAKPKKKITDLWQDASQTEPMLITALKDDLLLTLTEMNFSEEGPFSLIPGKTIYSAKLRKGESIYLETIRQEGMPAYGFTAQCGQQTRTYYFAYDGRFGTQKLEYLAGVPYKSGPIDEDSFIVVLAGVLAMQYHAQGPLSPEDPSEFWQTLAMAITSCHIASGAEPVQHIWLNATDMESYVQAIWPNLEDWPEIPDSLVESQSLRFDSKVEEYQIAPCYSSTEDFRYVKTVSDPKSLTQTIWIDVTDETGKAYPYQVHIVPTSRYYPYGLFGYEVVGVEKR